MSFSRDVKDELAGIYPRARHCKIAELAGIMVIAGEEGDVISLQSENDILQRKFFTLLLKAFNIEKGLCPTASGSGRRSTYRMILCEVCNQTSYAAFDGVLPKIISSGCVPRRWVDQRSGEVLSFRNRVRQRGICKDRTGCDEQPWFRGQDR